MFKTLIPFLGGIVDTKNVPIIHSHVPAFIEKANVEWMAQFNYNMDKRDIKKVEIDESLIKSGDFIATTRLDGLAPLIMYGTGSHVGHSTMALRFPDGELYVVESTDGWYWPGSGLEKHKFKDWI